MAGMRDMLMWMRTQQNKPEFAAAKRWLDRNQTPVQQKPEEPKKDIEVIDEKRRARKNLTSSIPCSRTST